MKIFKKKQKFTDTCTLLILLEKMELFVALFLDKAFVQFVTDVDIQGKVFLFLIMTKLSDPSSTTASLVY